MSTEIKVGCQTFTWEMMGKDWTGGTDDLLKAIAAGGYVGIEITDTMIGAYADRPLDFAAALEANGLTLVSIAFGSDSGFTVRAGMEDDLRAASHWIAFAAHFSGALVSAGSPTIGDEGSRLGKFEIAAEFYNRAGALGEAAGVTVAVHPSSHRGTLLFSRGDYDQMFALLDPALVGWVPDTGHILRGHHDILDVLHTYRDRIRYLHLKDIDAENKWAMLGKGVCDTAAIIDLVRSAPNFNGWLVLEEESDSAAADPAKAVRLNRDTMRILGF